MEKETKRITLLEAAEKMIGSNQVALVDNDNYFLVVANPNFLVINPGESDDAKYVFCITQNNKGNGQMRYIYFATESEAEHPRGETICASDELYAKVIDYFSKEKIVGIDVDQLGIFPIMPEFGSQYADLGIELFKMAK